ncbi:electron transfer flavoprotein subunit alpha/FixB family protein [Alkalicella caledoniensis]|uniref:Electron transfer flavoprotein subunit alpha/FixB family protein n=1 Tax=Alkalicella caledoniensis TaxID=2731377 RepID=A0A7G9W5C8_ALKCA|nr:electron transfer flavoprotein subunit alpha/FixB family protein [Alkalicella caledoniensis]QNO13890.1 electron transfer flavoprotein subunit alpha/FixB family protein [Alkalicella caledoniensis]
MSLNEYKGVWVFVEQRNGTIQKVSLELICKAREIADKIGGKVTAVILGAEVEGLANELIHYGADMVKGFENKRLEKYITEPYTKILSSAIIEGKPEIMLIGATTIGRDLAPRVAARVKTGLTADCTILDIDPQTNNLLMTRPAFGGNIMATIICPEHRPQMSSVRPGVMVLHNKDISRTGEVSIIEAEIDEMDVNVEIVEEVVEKKGKIKIEDADVLISGGRGIGAKDGFEALGRLAHRLNGLTSASRAAVDAGWVDKSIQVGQTGKTVRPNLYIAAGISGAIQHVAGMEEAEFIIAINSNPDAPIFDVADLGIVGDANKIIPALLQELA